MPKTERSKWFDRSMQDQGLEVKIALQRARKTQRWLLEQLVAEGRERLTEQFVSKILNGRYPSTRGREILEAAQRIAAGLTGETP